MKHPPGTRSPRPGTAVPGWILALALVLPAMSGAAERAQGDREVEPRRYTYSWQFTEDDAMAPRGGTTRGPALTLAPAPSDAWQRLTEPGLSGFERDRRAILAMAGGYRTTFDFIETIGFTPDYEPRPPYQSWATEYVQVIADEPGFISLQHILVMTFQQKDGSLSEPAVVKHWRQDWRYQDPEIHVYRGHDRWERQRFTAEEVRGTWSQAVFQVDDSPRYQAVGRWQYNGNHSTWTSGETWRPLPRREFSVRDDYDALVGTNRVTITPRGWIHEEDNLKVVLGPQAQPAVKALYLAREAGLNRYHHIVGYDFSAGEAYWQRTASFWRQVRGQWQQLFTRYAELTVHPTVDGERLFSVMFELAERSAEQEWSPARAQEEIRPVLDRFVEGRGEPAEH